MASFSGILDLLCTASPKRLGFILLHPLIMSTVQQYLFIFIAGFTAPSSAIRPLGFIILLITSYFAISSFDLYVDAPGWVARALVSAFPQTTLTYFERMIVREVSYSGKTSTVHQNGHVVKEEKVDAGTGKTAGTFRNRFAFGQEVATSMRGLGTPWEIKNIHPFSRKDPTYVPSVIRFVFWNGCKFVLCWYCHTWCIDTQLSLDKSYMVPENVAFFRRLNQVSWEEFKIRYIATVTTVVSLYCFMNGLYSFAAAVAVATKPSSIKNWRPVFGDLEEGYNLRRFWSCVKVLSLRTARFC
jgi:hypothetical protein